MDTGAGQSNDAGPSNHRPLRNVIHRRHHVTPPAHHVVQPGNTVAQSLRDSLPLLPTLMPTQPEQLYSTERTSVFLDAGPLSGTTKGGKSAEGEDEKAKYVRVGFQNPWDSWHKPTVSEVWNGLRWGHGPSASEVRLYEEAVAEARRREGSRDGPYRPGSEPVANATDVKTVEERGKDALASLQKDDLQLRSPDFSRFADNDTSKVGAHWLGHATVLLQLPPIRKGGDPIRIIFDPIFSTRCSPTQYVGPARLYPAPCSVADLPAIDVVCISHSHYDHLDYDSIVQLWRANQDQIRFVVPLDNKSWFLGLGLDIPEDLVTELDWWDETWLTDDSCDQQAVEEGSGHVDDDDAFRIRIVCTPAQHGSGRYGLDAGRSLWSSWMVERRPLNAKAAEKDSKGVFRAFFGGDTGFQFHQSGNTPDAQQYPTCPAFEEISRVIGPPHLSFLPISVGATFNFVKSYDAFGLLPVIDSGLTGANHMTPFDAVRVAKILSGDEVQHKEKGLASPLSVQRKTKANITMAIHWGTFVRDLEEVRQSMRDLHSACLVQGVRFVRCYDGRDASAGKTDDATTVFACLDIGDSIVLDV